MRSKTITTNSEFPNKSSENKRGQKKKVVQFTTLTIHEHPIIVGDNPSVSYGTPITIDWKSVSSSEYTIEDFEQIRSKEECWLRHSTKEELKIGPARREKLLLNLGFPRSERLKGTKTANIISSRRRSTVRNLHRSCLEEKLESIWRKILGKQRSERKYLERHVPSP